MVALMVAACPPQMPAPPRKKSESEPDICQGCRFSWDRMGMDAGDRVGHCYLFAKKVEGCLKRETETDPTGRKTEF